VDGTEEDGVLDVIDADAEVGREVARRAVIGAVAGAVTMSPRDEEGLDPLPSPLAVLGTDCISRSSSSGATGPMTGRLSATALPPFKIALLSSSIMSTAFLGRGTLIWSSSEKEGEMPEGGVEPRETRDSVGVVVVVEEGRAPTTTTTAEVGSIWGELGAEWESQLAGRGAKRFSVESSDSSRRCLEGEFMELLLRNGARDDVLLLESSGDVGATVPLVG